VSLAQRAIRLEALAETHATKREWAALWEWVRGLSREEGLAFLEFCLPTFVELGIAPPYPVLPSEMPVGQRREYADAFQKMIAGYKLPGAHESMSDLRMILDLWRRFVQRPSSSRSQ
jgi:hypothetical protein